MFVPASADKDSRKMAFIKNNNEYIIRNEILKQIFKNPQVPSQASKKKSTF